MVEHLLFEASDDQAGSAVSDALYLPRGKKIRFFFLRTIGNFFVLVSLYGLFTIFGPLVLQETGYRYRRLRGINYVVATSDMAAATSDFTKAPEPQLLPEARTNLLAALLKPRKKSILTPVDLDFGIVIPKIGANSRVLANIDAADYDSYMEALTLGVAHAVGTGLPGETGGNRKVYLFAHSTDFPWNVGRYNALFYLIKELEAGDEIDVFYRGRRHIYIVRDKKIVGPKDVAFLTEPSLEEELILQTCYPPGTTLDRLLVFARPKVAAESTLQVD